MYLYFRFWTRYFDFHGTVERNEYWLDMIVNLLLSFFSFFAFIITCHSVRILSVLFFIFYSLFYFARLVPEMSLVYRRINDCGFTRAGCILSRVIMTFLFVLSRFYLFFVICLFSHASISLALTFISANCVFFYAVSVVVVGCISSVNANANNLHD